MKTIKNIFTLVFVVTVLLSCGGDRKKEKEGFSYENKSSKEAIKEDPNLTNIVIVSDDLMKFNKTEIKAKSGKKVKLTLLHKGKMAANVMGHNVVILKKGVNVSIFASKAAAARDNDYVPKNSKDVIAYTKIIGGGQTTSIEFDAPAVGVYDFICSFPGHYAIMKGKFVVE